MTLRAALALINAMLLVVLILRLVRLKRAVDGYRPPSPLPRRNMLSGSLTITRVS